MKDTPAGLRANNQEAIEIKLWEVYLLRDRTNLRKTLSVYSLDKGPVNRTETDSDRVTFRFLRFDWEKTIRALLSTLSIPYDVAGIFDVDVFRYTTKKKVYIAEDDLNILFAIDTILEDAGYDVVLSHCGSPLMEANLPAADLFILDKLMPDVDGLDICRHLKSQVSTREVPVIMISAVATVGPKALRAGVDDFLEKPFKMHELLRLVARHTQAPAEMVQR